MPLHITELTDELIICGSWKFSRANGAEIDEDIEWGPELDKTGSYLLHRDKYFMLVKAFADGS